MGDKAQSVLDRLRTKARSSGKSFQLLLQLFCQEEFLRRVQHSNYATNLVLKGGLLIYCLSGFTSRPTMDIDFLLRRQPNYLPEIERMLNQIIAVATDNDYVVFEIVSISPIAEQREYSGVRAKLIGRIKNTRSPFHVDLGVGDVIVPKSEIRQMPTQLAGFKEPEIQTYSLESTIAEKFDAIISRMELSSRMKDYYDIYYLALTYRFDARELQEAITQTLQKRGTPYEKDTLGRVINFAQDRSMQQKWNNFIRGVPLESENLTLSDVLQTIDLFLTPLFSAIISETEAFGSWNPDSRQYEDYPTKEF